MKTRYVYLVKTLTKEPDKNIFEYNGFVQAFTSLKKAQNRMNDTYEINLGFNRQPEYEILKSGERSFIRVDYSVNKKDMDGNFISDIFNIRHVIEKIELR